MSAAPEMLRRRDGMAEWVYRALTNTLPPMIVGGSPIERRAAGEPFEVGPPRVLRFRLQAGRSVRTTDRLLAPGELTEMYGR